MPNEKKCLGGFDDAFSGVGGVSMRAFVCSLLSAAAKQQLTSCSCLDGRVEGPVECQLSLTHVTRLGPVAGVPKAERECPGHRDLHKSSNWTNCLLVTVLFDRCPCVQDEDSTGTEGHSQHKTVELLWEMREAMDMPASKPTSARCYAHCPVRVKVVKAADLQRFPLQALQS